jgi:Mg2+ and Co2+ transporter CorA
MASRASRPASVHARLYDARADDREVDVFAEPLRRLRDDQLLWVDVDGRERALLDRLATTFELDPETAARLARPDADRRAKRHDAYLHVALLSAETSGDRLVVEAVDLVAAPNLVITVRDGPLAAFEAFRDEVAATTGVGQLDTATFTTALVGSVLDGYLEQVEDLERRGDRLDDRALTDRDAMGVLDELAALRRRAALLRRALAPHRPAFAALARPDFAVNERLGRPWPALEERLDITLQAIESARELLLGTYEIVMTRSAQRTNDTIKLLTILSAVLLPASLIAGVLGMNFDLALFEEPSYFVVTLAVMVALMVGTLLIAIARDRA